MSVGPKTAEESPKYRSPEEIFVDNESVGKQSLANILKNHKQWLETDRRSGDRAVLDGADLSRANLSGANLQEARLNEAKLSGANLSEANLCEAQLNRADLSGANLQKAELKKALLLEANLEAASLDVAQLQKANLSQANLRGASLHWADLTEADLLETQLEGADLLKARLGAANFEGTDLTGAKGLLSGQLGGTVLAGAKLTQDLTKFEPLRIVEEVSKNARTVFVAILLGCLYCLLSIALATDADLLMNRESAPLPFVDRSIPIADFFFVAPVLLLCVYLYFHFYLQNLWGTLATLPAIFPDGIPLHEKAYPWLLNDRVRSHVVRLKENAPFLSRLREGLSIVLGWWTVPLILLLIWGRYLRCQRLGETTAHIVMLVVALVSAHWLNQLAKATLRGETRKAFMWKELFKDVNFYRRIAMASLVGAGFYLLSYGAINAVDPNDPDAERFSPSTWVPRAMAMIPVIDLSPFANLTDAEVSTKPETWTDDNWEDERPGLVPADLSGRDLRHARMERVFLVRANLEQADLRGANLKEAHLERADLDGADLEGANLSYAQLQGSQLVESILEGANLPMANLKGANLTDAKLQGANLRGSRLQEANLMDADLRGAALQETDGVDVTFQYADLRDAHL